MSTNRIEYAYKGYNHIFTIYFRTSEMMNRVSNILKPELSYLAKMYWEPMRNEWVPYITIGTPPYEQTSIEPKELRRVADRAYFTDALKYMNLINEWRDCLPHNGTSDPLATSRGCVRAAQKLHEEDLLTLFYQLKRIARRDELQTVS